MAGNHTGPDQSVLHQALVAWGNFVFHWRNTMFPIVIIAIFASLRPTDPWHSQSAGAWLNLVGILVAILGQVIRSMVVGLAYIKRGGVNKRVYADTLVNTGIFAHCRNPLYVGNAFNLLGLFIIHNNPYAYALGGVFFVVSYIAVVAAEERYLADKFGEQFALYCQTTPRWLIRLEGLGDTLSSMRFNWRRVIIKEYSSATSWIVTACALLAYEAVLRNGFVPGLLLNSSVAIGLITLLSAVMISRLKKSGRLKDE